MTHSNADLMREAYDAYGRDGIEGILPFLDPDVEWRNPRDSPIASVFRGHDGVREWQRLADEALEDMHFEQEGVEALRDDQVLATVRFRFKGRGSNIEVDVPFAHLVTFRDGKAVAVAMFTSVEAAREAAGLTE